MTGRKQFLRLTFLFLLTGVFTGCALKASNRRYAEAVEAYQNGEYGQAAELFQAAIEKNPDKAEFYIDYGFTLIQLGEYEEAKQQFERVISEKEIEMVKQNNKKAYRGLGIAAYCSGRYEQAAEWFAQALLLPEPAELDLDLLSYQGNALEMMGKLSEALEVYEKLSEEGKENAGFYRTRGSLYRKQGEYEKSLEDYDKALTLSDGDFATYLGKFAALRELGRESEAAGVLNKAEELPVDSDAELFALAQVHFYQGNITAAELEFGQVLSKGFEQAGYYLGEIALSQGRFAEARTALEEYLATGRPGTAALYNQLLVCCLQERDLEAAGEYLEKAKSFSDASIRQALARNEVAYLEYSGNFVEALDKMERYLVIYPEDEQAQKDLVFLRTRIPVDSGNEEKDGED